MQITLILKMLSAAKNLFGQGPQQVYQPHFRITLTSSIPRQLHTSSVTNQQCHSSPYMLIHSGRPAPIHKYELLRTLDHTQRKGAG